MHTKENHRTSKTNFQVEKATTTKDWKKEEDKMIEIGRVCVKIAGRDAGKKCVIVDILKGQYVMIDGETRRRKCNLAHLEPLDEKIDINKGASHDTVKKALEKLNIETRETKPKKKTIRPRKLRRSKLAKRTETPRVSGAQKSKTFLAKEEPKEKKVKKAVKAKPEAPKEKAEEKK